MNSWLQLMNEVKVATTFEQVRDAGERFGKIIGRESARAFAMLLMAAIGSTAKLFAAKVPTLPGSAQLAVQAEGTARIPLSALGAVEEIALSAEGVSVTVAATAMTNPANRMPLPGHYGPHPERYHQIVLDELAGATATCRSVVACRKALTGALQRLAKQIETAPVPWTPEMWLFVDALATLAAPMPPLQLHNGPRRQRS